MTQRTVQDLEAALEVAELDIDTDAIIRTVRRRAVARRRLRVVGSATAAALVVVGAAVPAAILLHRPKTAEPAVNPTVAVSPTSVEFSLDCTVAALPFPPEVVAMGDAVTKWLQVNDMDSTGRYVLSANFVPPPDGPVSIAILWDNGAPTLLPIPLGQFNVVAVNAHGVVTGYGGGDAPGYLWVYDGTLTRLPLPAGFMYAVPSAINDQGEVAGEAADDVNPQRAVVWDAAHTPHVLPQPADAVPNSASEAVAFAGNGVVVGTAFAPGLIKTPYVWSPDGTGRWLPVPSGYDFAGISGAAGQWAAGLLVSHGSPGGPFVPVRWDLRTGESIVADGSALMIVWEPDVDERGDLVTSLGEPGSRRAVIAHEGRTYDLPLLPGVTSGGADAVSDDGTVIAGTNAGSPAIWHC